MKTIHIIILCISVVLFSCELDNYDGPDAALSGSFIDAETGELVEQDIIRGTTIEITEHGYDPVTPQYLIVKNDGTYANSLLFSNTYTVQPVRGNFISVEPQEINISGITELDFEVTPYIRIRDAEIVNDGSKIVATFRVEQNVVNNVRKVGLYVHPDPEVGEPLRVLAVENEINATVDPNQVFTLELDLPSNTSILSPGEEYFFRVGALIDVGEAKLNYAPAVQLGI
jgi:Protein of unknown function (DUF3823) N-terminal domain/Domain of unknown function (DUF3823_C)